MSNISANVISFCIYFIVAGGLGLGVRENLGALDRIPAVIFDLP
jgi:hypothetical protein